MMIMMTTVMMIMMTTVMMIMMTTVMMITMMMMVLINQGLIQNEELIPVSNTSNPGVILECQLHFQSLAHLLTQSGLSSLSMMNGIHALRPSIFLFISVPSIPVSPVSSFPITEHKSYRTILVFFLRVSVPPENMSI